jgi:glycosyltransferase involved in cell wall biosynthesis
LDDKVKRVSTLIQTFFHFTEKHPDVDFIIVGEGEDGVSLRHMGETEAPGRVRILGWISSIETKVALYNVAECLCLISWREASPAVISEAFACGTPVLASQVGGIEDLVKEGKTGWLVKAGDDEALRGKFEFILENPTALDAMRRTVREVAQHEVSSIAVTNGLRKGFCAVGIQRD